MPKLFLRRSNAASLIQRNAENDESVACNQFIISPQMNRTGMNFPIHRTYLDYSNKIRNLSIYRQENPAWEGCILCAQELVDGMHGGYQFKVATDIDNEMAALGLLHKKFN